MLVLFLIILKDLADLLLVSQGWFSSSECTQPSHFEDPAMPALNRSDDVSRNYLGVIDVPKSRYHVFTTLNLSRARARFCVRASKTLEGVEVESESEEDEMETKAKKMRKSHRRSSITQ